MSILEATISTSLMPELHGATAREKWLNCAKDFPWYPLPWLMLANNENQESIQKANLWFNDEQRLHWLLNAEPWQSDSWLKDNLEKTLSNNSYPPENQHDITVHEVLVDNTITSTQRTPDPKDAVVEANTFVDSKNTTPHNVIEHAEKELLINTIDDNHINSTAFNPEIIEAHPKEIETGNDLRALLQAVTPASSSSIESSTPGPLEFEPFHSVDYFASQGIKLDLSAEPKDKFDRQLKSFTQWLKTMKKVTVQQATTAVADPVVEAQANQSNSGKEIITEAMALVLEKQGKYQKAADIYKKLLLLHPEKSVFFAAQIEELKNKQ